MADLTKSKGLPPDQEGNPGQNYPENATQSVWVRNEPLVTPEQVVSRYLLGIPLQSRIINPITQTYDRITPDIMQDWIRLSVNEAETLTHIIIMPTLFAEKLPMDRTEYESFGYFQLSHRPVSVIQSLTVNPSDNKDVFQVPSEWIETAGMTAGQINIIPLTIALASSGNPQNTQGGGGSAFLNVLAQKNWTPYFWRCTYVAGFKNNEIPTFINELIGILVALRALHTISATWIWTSKSMSIDGMSQSQSLPNNLFLLRIQSLEQERDLLVRKIRKIFGTLFITTSI